MQMIENSHNMLLNKELHLCVCASNSITRTVLIAGTVRLRQIWLHIDRCLSLLPLAKADILFFLYVVTF